MVVVVVVVVAPRPRRMPSSSLARLWLEEEEPCFVVPGNRFVFAASSTTHKASCSGFATTRTLEDGFWRCAAVLVLFVERRPLDNRRRLVSVVLPPFAMATYGWERTKKGEE